MTLQSKENGKTVEHILLGMKCKVSWLYSTRIIKIYLRARSYTNLYEIFKLYRSLSLLLFVSARNPS